MGPTTPQCENCDVGTDHFPDLSLWVCPYCGDASPGFFEDDDGPVLAADSPFTNVIMIRGLLATDSGLKAVLDPPLSPYRPSSGHVVTVLLQMQPIWAALIRTNTSDSARIQAV